RAAGWEGAVVDSRPFGGTCALRGCDPKKVLVGAAEIIDWNNRLAKKGIKPPNVKMEWPALMRFKPAIISALPEKSEKGFAAAGIATFHGRARFVDQTTVSVGGDTLTGRYVVIATGARPASQGITGEEYLTTSEQFLELESLPDRIIFVGGGYISFE